MSTPRKVRSVFLVGHADTRGTAAANLALGQQRATVVRARLTAALEALKPGLAQSIGFVTESMGETQPRFSTTTEDGRARNRRVEVMLGRI
jgi:outer membrane protein OmpA-like peptidoglycan-associated protein